MIAPRIVVVGSVNTDMVIKGRRLPGPGETVTGGRFFTVAGGKGANQAVAAARLDAEVTLIAKVGSDRFGDQSIENFRREGIHTDCVLRDAENHTGMALILVADDGENLISVAPGANHVLSSHDVMRFADRICTADMVMLQLEIPIDVVSLVAQIASGAGVPVMLDPAPAAPLPRGLLENVAYLTPNESEAERLTGIPVTDETSARRAAELLLSAGARHVLITLGAKGVLLAQTGRMVLIPTTAVDAVDTTAAGDAFNGGLAWALGSGESLDVAVRRACLIGALAATKLGAQSSLPTREDLADFEERTTRRTTSLHVHTKGVRQAALTTDER